nr:restriction endonuclease [Fulvivirga marina]
MSSDKDWRNYEKQIFNNLGQKFPGCSITFDDSIFGIFSKTDRQIDISIRGELAGNKILGVVDCKYYSKKIDVKAVESFLGMLEDLNANIGIMITNDGYSQAAINRASVKNLKLEIVKIEELALLEVDVDEIINQKILNLRLSKFEFFKRLKENWSQFDEVNSSYAKRLITFKEGFANTEFYAFKNSIKESARIFRDFAELSKVTIRIPANKQDESTNWREEKRVYECSVTRTELESFLQLDFWELRQDIKKWRKEFLENTTYTKQSVIDFANKYITSKKV